MPRRRNRPSNSALSLPLEMDQSSPAQSRRAAPSHPTANLSQDSLLLASNSVLNKMDSLDEWAASPYAWIRALPTATRSKAAEAILETLLCSAGYLVQPRCTTGHDRLVAGSKVKIRFSTRWSSGLYTFQQVLSGDYELLVLFGLSPNEGHLWVLDRTATASMTDSRSGWLSFDPDTPPDSLATKGGTVNDFMSAALVAFGQPSQPQIPIAT